MGRSRRIAATVALILALALTGVACDDEGDLYEAATGVATTASAR